MRDMVAGVVNAPVEAARDLLRQRAHRAAHLPRRRAVRVGGTSCPDTLSYTTYTGLDTGPPSDQYVSASPTNARAAFAGLITR